MSNHRSTKKRSPARIQRDEFYEQLLKLCHEKTNLFAKVKLSLRRDQWLRATAGKKGIRWCFGVTLTKEPPCIGLGFSEDKSSELNKRRFKTVHAHKEELEKLFGEPLVWNFKQGRIMQYVRSYCPVGTIQDETKWKAIQDDLLNRLIRMEKAFKSIIKQID